MTNRNAYNVGIEGESISARGDNDYSESVPMTFPAKNSTSSITAENLARMNDHTNDVNAKLNYNAVENIGSFGKPN